MAVPCRCRCSCSVHVVSIIITSEIKVIYIYKDVPEARGAMHLESLSLLLSLFWQRRGDVHNGDEYLKIRAQVFS
jgi:hypothetical protein